MLKHQLPAKQASPAAEDGSAIPSTQTWWERETFTLLRQGKGHFPAAKLKATCTVHGDLVLRQLQRKMPGFTTPWEFWNHNSLGLHIQVSSVPLKPCTRPAALGEELRVCGMHSNQILDCLGSSRHFLEEIFHHHLMQSCCSCGVKLLCKHTLCLI